MHYNDLPQPNKKKIDQLFETINKGETEHILAACETFIVEDEFFQWEGTPQIRRQREANKRYFMENGGIQILTGLISSTTDDLVKRFGTDVLWAYSETDENRRELLYGGVLPVVCECLKHTNPKVQEGAVGALWQLLEYEPIQTKTIEEGLLEPLVTLLVESKVTRTQTRAAGCLHLISWNEKCRPYIIQTGAFEKLLSVDSTALMVNYFRLLCVANVMLNPDHFQTIAEHLRVKALDQIATFVKNETPEGVRSIEDRLMYIWVSMGPYIPLVYSEVKEIFMLGMFAFANLTGKADNRNIMVAEEIKDKVMCLSWTNVPEARKFAESIYKNLTTTSKHFEPPTLYSIVYNYLNNHHRK